MTYIAVLLGWLLAWAIVALVYEARLRGRWKAPKRPKGQGPYRSVDERAPEQPPLPDVDPTPPPPRPTHWPRDVEARWREACERRGLVSVPPLLTFCDFDNAMRWLYGARSGLIMNASDGTLRRNTKITPQKTDETVYGAGTKDKPQ